MTDPNSGGTWKWRTSGLFVPNEREDIAVVAKVTNSGNEGAEREARVDLAPYVISAAPFLVPLIAMTVLGDPAILRALLWQGNLVAMFIGMLQAFLPLIIGSALIILLGRFGASDNVYRTTTLTLVVTGPLLVFTPVGIALVELGLLAALLALLWVRNGRRTGRRRAVIAVMVIMLGTTALGAYLWTAKVTSLPGSLAARALYGLPRETAIENDGSVWVYYLVASDEQFTTVITGNPTAIRNLRTEDIAMRLPCRNHDQGLGRSLFSLLTGEQGLGTAYCGELATCLRSVTQPATRHDRIAIDRCIREATGI